MVIPSFPFALGDKPIRVEYEATALDGESVSVVASSERAPTCLSSASRAGLRECYSVCSFRVARQREREPQGGTRGLMNGLS